MERCLRLAREEVVVHRLHPLLRSERKRLPFLPKAVTRNYRNTRALLKAGPADNLIKYREAEWMPLLNVRLGKHS